MIKGISRQIVEVTDTTNPYFERAFLVVRTQCADMSQTHISQEAHRLLQSQKAYSGLRRARRRALWSRAALLSVGSILGYAIASLLQLL